MFAPASRARSDSIARKKGLRGAQNAKNQVWKMPPAPTRSPVCGRWGVMDGPICTDRAESADLPATDMQQVPGRPFWDFGARTIRKPDRVDLTDLLLIILNLCSCCTHHFG